MSKSFPRSRGDVPGSPARRAPVFWFSPLTRGCSLSAPWRTRLPAVFPAHAGMFLCTVLSSSLVWSFPRSRGDVPAERVMQLLDDGFSPLTRGCSFGFVECCENVAVFPAHAGMFLRHARPPPGPPRFPRSRGDVPGTPAQVRALISFSPLTRGCSRLFYLVFSVGVVFPAHAGMFRFWKMNLRSENGFPRSRGDVPALSVGVLLENLFSPLTRGCSTQWQGPPLQDPVFPAHAGMFLLR